ncbi:flavin reductase family protein [Paucibacter sediminis]|uniref:Flavin reductase family protein n=1 Tax=Paucibacter sediminis TaxID=3019553 RepID=A0AA95NAT3_9BURK|nr:flavin reductase family protein [Paucibacter sp. S2-9]WIT11637.1 flavin reductase family protein [Paucibacter sp. S2-9]
MTAVATQQPATAVIDDAARQLRRTLGCYPTGVTVVTTRAPDGRPVGLTVNSFASLSLEPPLLLWSLANRSPNLRAFRSASHFAINVLAHGQHELAMRFANPALPDKFEGVALHEEAKEAAALAPLIRGSLAWFVCAGRDAIETGDHTLFIGRIVQHAAQQGTPLVFHAGAFARLEEA